MSIESEIAAADKLGWDLTALCETHVGIWHCCLTHRKIRQPTTDLTVSVEVHSQTTPEGAIQRAVILAKERHHKAPPPPPPAPPVEMTSWDEFMLGQAVQRLINALGRGRRRGRGLHMRTIQEGIDAIHSAGWAVQGLGFYRHPTIRPGEEWGCRIYPATFGRYVWFKMEGKSYGYAQAMIQGTGATPLLAIEDALKKLHGSEEQALYKTVRCGVAAVRRCLVLKPRSNRRLWTRQSCTVGFPARWCSTA